MQIKVKRCFLHAQKLGIFKLLKKWILFLSTSELIFFTFDHSPAYVSYSIISSECSLKNKFHYQDSPVMSRKGL